MHIRVPGSTSNIGSGFDCLGLAVDLWLSVEVRDGSGATAFTGTLSSLDPDRDVITQTLRAAGHLADRHLAIESAIPVGRGLGSSAAAAVAATVLGTALSGTAPDRDRVFESTAATEGHPDNAAPAVYGGLVLVADRPRPRPFHPNLGVALAVPDETIETNAARAILPPTVPFADGAAQAARAAALLAGLADGDGDLIGFGMDDVLAVPHRRDLIPGFDAAVAAGRAAGAFGVTISGSGSTLLAIGPSEGRESVAGAMCEALAAAGNPATPATPAVNETGYQVGD